MRVSSQLAPVQRVFRASLLLSALALPLLAPSGAGAATFDADNDTTPDWADASPCDPGNSALLFAPAMGEHGLLLFEDQFPYESDFDYNDVAVAYNYVLQVNSAGQVTKIRATFNALAAGGTYDNGLGLHLSVPTSSVARITKTIGSQPTVQLSPSPQDNELVIPMSNNVRELFTGQTTGPINSDPNKASLPSDPMVVEISFSTPVSLDTGAAPFDLYIFRTQDTTLQVHLPQYAGTANMNASLFGQGNDGSTLSRHFVTKSGLPYALSLPSSGLWPREAVGIDQVFPHIVGFASSGGTADRDFYARDVAEQLAYTPPNGYVRPTPRFVGPDREPAATGCIQTWGLSVDFGSSRNQFAYGSTVDAAGDVYVTGYVQGAFPGFTNAGGLDLFVAKYDGDTGNELWLRQVGGAADDVGRDLVVDATTGDVYVTGESRSGALGGSGALAGGSDAFLMKLNASGALQWTRLLGGTGQDTGAAIDISPLGDIYIGGGSTSRDIPGTTDPGNSPSSFLAKYNTSGQLQWTRAFRTDADNAGNYNYTLDIAVDPTSGAVYSVGAERRYNRDASAAENQFITKTGSDGTVLYTQHLGDYGYYSGVGDYRYAFAYGVSVDPADGSPYVTGSWYGGATTAHWGEWSRAAGDTSADATLVKLNSAGQVVWTYTLASTDAKNDYGESVLAGSVLAGRTEGTLPGQVSRGGSDLFVAAYDYTGNRRYIIQDGTTANDIGHVAALRALGQSQPSLFIVGNTTGALGGVDQGHYDVGIYRYDYASGVRNEFVIASKLGWQISDWTQCTASCGGGTQSRSVVCKRADGVTVADGMCIGTKPITSQACGTTPCYTYAWSTGSFGACTASCGGGTQTRAVVCQRSDGATVADSFCTGTKPGTTQVCNTQTCYTYAWYQGAWSGCDRACGTGTQTRTVFCQRSDGAQVTDGSCGGTKPATIQSCNTQSCGAAGKLTHWNASCRNILASGASTGNGIYAIDPDGTGPASPFNVYCDMSTQGGGWTIIHPNDTGKMRVDVHALRNDTSHVMIYLRRNDGVQFYTYDQQLPAFAGYEVDVSEYDYGFVTTFIPRSVACVAGQTQGFVSNGQTLAFTNCDANPNSYFIFYRPTLLPSTYFTTSDYSMSIWFRNSKAQLPSPFVPADYFAYSVEMHFGGCGTNSSDKAWAGYDGVIAAALGIR